MRALSLLAFLLASSAAWAGDAADASAPGAQGLAQAFASVPPQARLLLETERSAFPEVQLLSLAEAEALRSDAFGGRALFGAYGSREEPANLPRAQASAPRTRGAAPLTAPVPRVANAGGELRAFWFAAGTSAVASLGTRVLLLLPAWLGLAMLQGSVFGPVGSLVAALGVAAGFFLTDAAVAALASTVVFDSSNRLYTSSYVASFAGHVMGNALGVGVLGLSVGFGGLLLYGIDALGALSLQTAFGAMWVFSALGAMPVLVVAFLASVALPALLGAWATVATARPREGFVIDPTWRPHAEGAPAGFPRVIPEDRTRPPLRTLLTVALPGT